MIAAKFVCDAICRQPQQFIPVRHRSFRELKKKLDAGLKPFSDEDYAYNDSEKRTGLLKPRHTVEEQIEYMQSKEYFNVYGDRPVWETWIRNLKGQLKMQPPLRLFCIDRNGRFNVNHACPVCRDEYFFFHYQNPKLIEHFLVSGTDIPITNRKTGLCMEQLINLQAEVIRAKEHGTMPFNVEFRHFDYSEWYPGLWKPKKQFNVAELPSRKATVDDIYPNPAIKLTAHKRDYNTHWDEWWVRHAEFARLNKRKLH